MAKNEEEPVVSKQECLKALEKIRRFLIFHKTLPDSGLVDVEDAIIRAPTRQTCITDFFENPNSYSFSTNVWVSNLTSTSVFVYIGFFYPFGVHREGKKTDLYYYK